MLTKEIDIFKIFSLHQLVLEQIILKNRVNKIVSFELVGRMSAIESKVARAYNVNYLTVQTALISQSPLPIFPLASTFFADSAPMENLLTGIGYESNGRVLFSGSPYKIQESKDCDLHNTVAFFTQPYELENNLKILEVLLEWASKKGITLIIRYHPRDRSTPYQYIIKKYNMVNIVEDDNKCSVKDILDKIDFSILKTSSIAKESIASGIPTIFCLWSRFDLSLNADYFDRNLDLSCYTYSEFDLCHLLNSSKLVSSLKSSTRVLQRKMFLDQGIKDLVEGIKKL